MQSRTCIAMATCIPAGSGTLQFTVTNCKGNSCRKTALVSDAPIARFLRKDLSW